MNRQEIEQRIKYLENYIELLYSSIDDFEEELGLLRKYITTEKMGEGENE